MDWTLIVALLVLGCATGFVAGLLGIGGGMLLVPFLTMLFTIRAFPEEHLVHMAIATSLATIMFTSVSSVRAHHKRGAVLWPVVKVFAPGILVGSLVGAQIRATCRRYSSRFSSACSSASPHCRCCATRSRNPHASCPGRWGCSGSALRSESCPASSAPAAVSSRYRSWCGATQDPQRGRDLGCPRLPDRRGRNRRLHHRRDIGDSLPPGTVGFVYLPALLAVGSGSVLTRRSAQRWHMRSTPVG